MAVLFQCICLATALPSTSLGRLLSDAESRIGGYAAGLDRRSPTVILDGFTVAAVAGRLGAINNIVTGSLTIAETLGKRGATSS